MFVRWCKVSLSVSVLVIASFAFAANSVAQPVTPKAQQDASNSACPAALAGLKPLAATHASVASGGAVRMCVHRIIDPKAEAGLRKELAGSGGATRTSRANLVRPDSAGSTPVPFPSWCPTGGGGAVYHLTAACNIETYEDELINANTGEIVGTLDYNVLEYAYWETDLLAMINQIELDPYYATGESKVGPFTTLSGQYGSECTIIDPKAGISCSTSEYHFPAGAAFYAPPDWPTTTDHISGYAAYDSSYTAGTESRLNIDFQWGIQYSGPIPTVPNYYFHNNNFLTYCDNNLPGVAHGGCKAPTDLYTPVLTYHLSTYPHLAKAIQAAQAKGVPGAPSSRRWLTRSTNATITNQNRGTACPSSWKTPTGYQCDEYPAAATYQGAAYNPTKGITFSFCQNPHLSQTTAGPKWESCYVPSGENSSEGGFRLQQWNANRTLDNDRFYIHIVA